VREVPSGKELLRVRPADPRQLAPEVTAYFDADASRFEPLFYDGGHPDAAGYALYAETVASFLRDQGLVPTR
jgi:lysophospholipase L1-like esterase